MSWQRVLRLLAGRRFKYAMLALWLALAAVASPLAAKLFDVTTNGQISWLPRSAEATEAYERATAAFPETSGTFAVVVYARDGGLTAADHAKTDRDRSALTGLARQGQIAPAAPSDDGTALLLSFPLEAKDDKAISDALDTLKDRLAADRPDGLQVALTGPAGFAADIAQASSGVDTTLILVTAGIFAVLLLITYRSPVLWLVPLLSAGIASQVASAVVYLLARYGDLTVNAQSQGIVTVLVFGAGTDYALLLIDRYREELRRSPDRHEALAVALRACWPALLASAATVTAALLCLLAARLNSTRGMGPGAAVGVGAAFLVTTTLLPALLVLCGRWLLWPFVPRFDPTVVGRDGASEHGGWTRVARAVARHPRRTWVGTALVLAALALGMLGMSTGLSAADTFTGRVDSVTGQQLVTAHYPGGASASADIIAAADRADQVAAAARVPGVAAVQPAQISADGRWARITAVLADPPTSQAGEAAMTRLRAAVHAVPHARALTGGQTAINVDTRAASDRDNRTVIPLILGIVLLGLIALLRARLAPLLLIASVVLSYATAMGLSRLLFTALGYPTVDTGVPLLAFLLLVALGVDYTIFLMTGAKEEAATLGHRADVLHTLAVTGGVITSTGVVLAATFAVLTLVPTGHHPPTGHRRRRRYPHRHIPGPHPTSWRPTSCSPSSRCWPPAHIWNEPPTMWARSPRCSPVATANASASGWPPSRPTTCRTCTGWSPAAP